MNQKMYYWFLMLLVGCFVVFTIDQLTEASISAAASAGIEGNDLATLMLCLKAGFFSIMLILCVIFLGYGFWRGKSKTP